MGLVTLRDIKIYLRLPLSKVEDDERLEIINNQVSAMVESYCGRVFSIADYTEYFDGGVASVFITNTPINTVSRVSQYTGSTYDVLGDPNPLNGSFLEISGNPATITASGNTKISTRTSKFGDSSAKFDGVGDYITTPDSNDFKFETEPFTIEAQVSFNNVSAIHTIASHSTDANNYWSLEVDFANSKGLTFKMVDSGVTTIEVTENSSSAYSIGSFHHLAVTRDGANFKVFRANTDVSSVAVTSNLEIINPTGNLTLGRNAAGANNYIRGFMDEFRLSWESRYTSNFQEVTLPFTTDLKTKLLLHMDGEEDSSVFPDSTKDVNGYVWNKEIGKINIGTGRAINPKSIIQPKTFNNYPNGVKVVYKGGYSVLPDDLKNAVLELIKLYNKGIEGTSSLSLQGESITKVAPSKDGFPPHIRRVLSFYKVI